MTRLTLYGDVDERGVNKILLAGNEIGIFLDFGMNYDKKNLELALTKKVSGPEEALIYCNSLYPSYPGIFDELFGDNLIHQFCLLHLNKLIVGDLPKNTTIEQELMKYSQTSFRLSYEVYEVIKVIRIEFTEEELQTLDYERCHYPRVQRKMEALWLKSR
jgi:hypothetical protein